MRHPLLLPTEKNVWEACLLFASAIKKSSLYVVMSMESRDILYIRTSVSNTHVRVSALRMKFKS